MTISANPREIISEVQIMEPYEELANAIILQAVKDYRKALKHLANCPQDYITLSVKQGVERFFRSRWFEVLTSIDPEMLICRLNAEVM
jgi:hypothetical protein